LGFEGGGDGGESGEGDLRGDTGDRRRGGGEREEGGDFGARVNGSGIEEGILDERLVGSSTCGVGERIREPSGRWRPRQKSMAAASRWIRDELAVLDLNCGELVVVEGGADEGGTDSQEADVKGPRVFEGRADSPEEVGAHQGVVGEGGTIKGDNQFANGSGEGLVEFHREEEEEHEVGEDGDDEDVNKENPLGEGKRADVIAELGEAFEGFLVGFLVDIAEGDLATNEDPQVSGRRLQ
jgi:hypothetical protein